jgi:serine/threonine protein kinase
MCVTQVLDKNEMRRRNQIMNVRSERNLLAVAESPWLVKLHCSFQDRDNLYFAMEYLPGGDFMTLLQVTFASHAFCISCILQLMHFAHLICFVFTHVMHASLFSAKIY